MMKTIVVCDVDGTLTDGSVYVGNGAETLRFCKRDGWLLGEAMAGGIEAVMVSDDPNTTPARDRARKLGVEFFPCAAPTDDAAEVSATKAGVVKRYKAEGHRVVYIGDSPADLEAMREADEAWCPADARLGPEAKWTDGGILGAPPHYTLGGKRVTVAPIIGGHGVLHEVLGYLLARAK